MITSEWPTADCPGSGVFVAQQVRFLRSAGVDIDVFAFRGAKSPWRYLRAWSEVRKRLRRERYDLVHAQFGQSGLLALPKRLPLVVTFRGSDLQGVVGRSGRYLLSGSILKAVSRVVSLFADQIIVVSEAIAKHLPSERAYHVIPSGLDLERFQPGGQREARERLGLPAERRLILFGGNPDVSEKRFSLARDAVERLRRRWDVDLVVAKGVPQDLVPTYMSACDLLLLTSSHEGSPNMVKEALACNLRVVSVDVGDVRVRLGKSDGCVVCDDDRPETIAAGLEKVLRDTRPFDGRSLLVGLDERILSRRVVELYRRTCPGVCKIVDT
jgi:glycosyltransferase involved in cell wall biosynthesis